MLQEQRRHFLALRLLSSDYHLLGANVWYRIWKGNVITAESSTFCVLLIPSTLQRRSNHIKAEYPDFYLKLAHRLYVVWPNMAIFHFVPVYITRGTRISLLICLRPSAARTPVCTQSSAYCITATNMVPQASRDTSQRFVCNLGHPFRISATAT
jgi:hypothetical protein